MKRFLLFLIIILLLLTGMGAFGQEAAHNEPSNPENVSSLSAKPDSSGKSFCICRIVSFSADNNYRRTDAIFAGSTSEKKLSTKQLLKNIQDELLQAMVFFYSYKTIKQYKAKSDCASLYATLKKKHEDINRLTVLLPSVAKR